MCNHFGPYSRGFGKDTQTKHFRRKTYHNAVQGSSRRWFRTHKKCSPKITTLGMRIKFWPPPPTLDFLSKDFCLQPGRGWKFLLRRTCCRGKNCSHCSLQSFHSLTKANQVSLVRIRFSHPESDEKSADVGVGGRIGILMVGLNQMLSGPPAGIQ